MRKLSSAALILLMLLATACAALKATESLPSPTRGLPGGPEGEPEYIE